MLEASIESLIVADEILPKLEDENKQLQANNATLTSQLETLEKQLEEERNSRRAAEDSKDTKIKEVEESWTAVLAEKQNNWAAREKGLEERADNQERLLKELKASYEVSERLGRGDDIQSSASQASAAELEMMNAELERANLRIAEVESRNEQLRIELAQNATQNSGKSNTASAVEDDPAFLRLRSENSSLIRKLNNAKLEREAEKRGLESTTRALRKDVAAMKEDNESMKSRLENWKDYDNIKRELEVLKSIEFNIGEAEDENPDTLSLSNPSGGTQELEQLLLARNKKLNDDLTLLRVAHTDLQSRSEMLQEDLSTTNQELEKSRILNATLESDLARAQDEVAPSIHPAMSVAGRTQASRYPSNNYNRRVSRFSPTSSIISGFDPASNGLESPRGGGYGGNEGGILPILTAQRDRFKKRITELDAELAKSHNTVTSLRSEVAALQKDNLNLYEKSRYVSTYTSGKPAASSPTYAANPSTIQMPDDTVSDRYRPAYENKISPFAAFRGREQARAIRRMSLPERALLQLTKWVFTNRASRNVFGAYFVLVHLVLVILLCGSGGGAASAAEVVGGGGLAGVGAAAGAVVGDGVQRLKGAVEVGDAG